MKRVLLTSLFLAVSLAAAKAQLAKDPTPVGRWKTVDDSSGKAESIVRIWEEHRILYGRIEKLLDPKPDDPTPRCTLCEGDLKDQPVMGLRILWNLHKSSGQWIGGKILDPDNGKVYQCSIALEDGGKRLKVRGYIGFSLFGRTQYWSREE